MELAKIEKWIEKYFEGTTTIEEEKALKAYFSSNEVAPHLRQYQPVFRYFSEAGKERSARELQLAPKRKKNRYTRMSVAAVVAVVLGIWFSNRSADRDQETLLAYEETIQALYLIGENLNKGAEKVEYLNEFEDTKNRILPSVNR